MGGFVVYKPHTGWFHWTTADQWDSPTYKLNGERVDTRIEIARCDTLREAKDVRHAYNMMCNGAPTDNPMFNRLLEESNERRDQTNG